MAQPINIIENMNDKACPLSNDELSELVNQAVTSSASNVIFTKHCELRMEERDITRREVWTCLRRGLVFSDPSFNAEYGTWEFKFREPPPRDIVCVVVAVELSKDDGSVYTLTVYEV